MAFGAVLVGSNSGAQNISSSAGTTSSSSTFVIALSYDGTANRTGLTDSKGNTYTQCGTTLTDSGHRKELWRCSNGVGGASHTASVTYNTNAFGSIYLIEITDAAASSFDVTAQGTDASSPFEVSTGTLAQINECVITIVGNGASNNPMGYASSNTTILAQQGDGSTYWTSAVSAAIRTSTGSFTPSFTSNAAATHGLITAAFKAATAGTPGGIMRTQGGIGTGGMQSMGGGMQGRSRSRIIVPANFHAFRGRGARPELRV